MSYNRTEELFSELCSMIDEMIGVNKKIVERTIRGEKRELTEISSKYSAYDKGTTVIFSFDDADDYETVMKKFKNSNRMITYDDSYLEFRLKLI